MPVPSWRAGEKSVYNYAGFDHDFLFFQSPLEGDYEIDCEMTTFGWRETQLMVGGSWVSPVTGMKHYDVGDLRENLGRRRLDPAMWSRGDVPHLHCRVVVQDGMVGTYFNGRLIHQVPHGGHQDPWVAIRSEHDRHGGVRDLRITGNPTVPSELKLLHDVALRGWVPYYEETIGKADADWHYEGTELIGRHTASAGKDHESLVYYHRPMLEDGSIEYEFFYDREQSHPHPAHVHPVLDRVAFLLEPDGVKIHWCTDGIHDRTELSPANSYEEPQNRVGPVELPLVPDAWNKAKLSLAGDTIELRLNGALVYRRVLEPSNMRQFGLFHYSDRTAARVRNIIWKGDWPRQLPPLAEQELADGSLIAELDAELPDMELFEHDFAKDGPRPDVLQLSGDNPPATVAYRDDGLHLTVPGANPDRWHDHKLEHRFSLLGDFDISASFDQLNTAAPQEHKYAGVALVACLQCEPYVNLWIHRRRAGSDENHHFIDTTSQRPAPDGEVRWDTWRNRPNESTSGTFRLVRRGKTVYYLYADGDSKEFRLHRSMEASDAPVRMNGLWLFTQTGGIGQTSVVWKKVIVRADRITPNPTETAARQKVIVDALTRQLTSPSAKVVLRRRAAQGLAASGATGIAVLIKSLAHENRDVQLESIAALGALGETAQPAVPALEKLTGNSDERVRVAAEQALATIKGRTFLKGLLNLFD